MTIALATRGYVSAVGAGGLPDVLTYLYPETITIDTNDQLIMAVILSSVAGSDKIVDLVSDDPSVLVVPSDVTIPTGQAAAVFIATATGSTGSAQVTATLGTVNKLATVSVVDIVDLKPKVTKAVNLRPLVYDAEES